MQKRLNEIACELREIENKASEVRASVDFCEESKLEELLKNVEEMENFKRSLLSEKAEIEARMEEAEAIKNGEIHVEVEERETQMENKITLSSPEYRDAFYSYIRGTITEEQRAVLKTPISVDGDGTNDGQAIALPKGLDDMIWDNIHTEHPVLNDIAYLRTGIVMEVTRHTAMTTRVSGKKDGATGTGAEENTFVKVSLAGVDYEKYVELTYAEAKMSVGALEMYLANEISAELGEALAKDVFARVLTDVTTAQKVTATSSMVADIKNALAKCTGASKPVIYAPSNLYYGIVAQETTGGNPFNIGAVLGVEVKKDDAATCVTVFDPKQFVCNEVQPIMIESSRDLRTHRVIVSGYLRAEGTMRNVKAGSYIA